jgi:hypothetical protein
MGLLRPCDRVYAPYALVIFDGLAVKSKQSAQARYVPGEQVAAIFPGEVTLKIASAETDTLEPFSEPAPQTRFSLKRHRSGFGGA